MGVPPVNNHQCSCLFIWNQYTPGLWCISFLLMSCCTIIDLSSLNVNIFLRSSSHFSADFFLRHISFLFSFYFHFYSTLFKFPPNAIIKDSSLTAYFQRSELKQKEGTSMWAYNETFYQIYPIGFCGRNISEISASDRSFSIRSLNPTIMDMIQEISAKLTAASAQMKISVKYVRNFIHRMSK